MAYEVASKDREVVITYLRAREQVTMVYLERKLPILLDGSEPEKVNAICYVVDRAHAQYAGALPLDTQLKTVRSGVGQSGANPEYVLNTADHLSELGIRDQNLQWLASRLRE